MPTLQGLPYVRIEFKKSGDLLTAVPELCPPGTTDLVVISHGWHQDGANAEENLYKTLVGNMKAAASWPASRKVAIAGIFWPSDKFRDDLTLEDSATVGGQAAAAGGGDVDEAALVARAREIAGFLKIKNKAAFVLQARRAANGGGDADVLVDMLRAATAGDGGLDDQTRNEHEDLLTRKGSKILNDLKAQPPANAGLGAAAGGPAGGGQAMGVKFGAKAAVAKILNQFAYFELKKRAGLIGQKLGLLLNKAKGLDGVRIHLVGHSFGARLVTAAASVMTRKPASLSLLQGAFSHSALTYGFNVLSHRVDGAYRNVIDDKKVTGPILITHTWKDTAVGLAYAAASRVSQTVAARVGVTPNFGGPDDIYGGMGANGALRLAAGQGSARTADGTTTKVVTTPGFVNNLKCDFIANHNDVSRPEVARLVALAMG